MFNLQKNLNLNLKSKRKKQDQELNFDLGYSEKREGYRISPKNISILLDGKHVAVKDISYKSALIVDIENLFCINQVGECDVYINGYQMKFSYQVTSKRENNAIIEFGHESKPEIFLALKNMRHS